MKINREVLLACPPDEAADLLFEMGKTLRGRNLKKSSWLLIANGLHVTRISDIVGQRLEAAITREDALRVLRIARKWVRTRKAAKGAHHQAPQENPLAIAAETSPQMYEEDEAMIRWDLWEEEEVWPRENYEEWLAEQENMDPTGRTRHPGLLAVSHLQEAIDRYAWDRRNREHYRQEDVRSYLDDKTYSRLLALANHKPCLNFTEAEMAFLRENHLDQLVQYVEQPDQQLDPAPIQDGVALAGLRLIEDHSRVKSHPFSVDWEAVAVWLTERLMLKPVPESVPTLIACAYAFFRDAPVPLLTQFLNLSTEWHGGWNSLLGYAFQRTSEILPDKAPPKSEPLGWWGISGAYVNDVRWERVLDAGTGSQLVLHNLKKNLEDIFQHAGRLKNRYWNGARKLLLAGGGTLRRMDYPAFTLVCRPSISLVRLETFTLLTNLALELVELNNHINTLKRSSLAAWIEDTFESLSPDPLPDGLAALIAGILERHAIAYLMLKERVLSETFQVAPFRLRRKHIQRFWASQGTGRQQAGRQEAERQEAGEVSFTIPADLEVLRTEFGSESVKEALTHALLDHFKDTWELPEDAGHRLKETLLILLRSVTVTYHLREPWLPPFGQQPEENDLEHTQEVANFLIQQTEHALLEMAHALLVDPQQGLPLLAGGQMTVLERNCRRLVKATAGVSQKKVSGGEARIFTCRPLAKHLALDRGTLGGDCSSSSVPMRALSPHHTYYGIFENGEQQRGYITVYEAAAEIDGEGEEATGERLPVLCLETINVPLRVFDAIQQDLLVIFEAVAKSRGLTEGLVLISGLGTWNYQNGEVLHQSRRFRQGRSVRLFPADPASWNVYHLLAPEAERYTAFFDDVNARHYRGYMRLLAPFQPELDPIEPENLAEAQRIATLTPKKLHITARSEGGPVGFISELPEIE